MQKLIERLRWLAEYEADLADESKWERIEWEAADMLETQAAMIKQMALEYISEQGQWIDELAKYKSLCDQMGEALEYACKSVPPLSTVPGIELAISAWRETC